MHMVCVCVCLWRSYLAGLKRLSDDVCRREDELSAQSAAVERLSARTVEAIHQLDRTRRSAV